MIVMGDPFKVNPAGMRQLERELNRASPWRQKSTAIALSPLQSPMA
jgi:hypothetical protein